MRHLEIFVTKEFDFNYYFQSGRIGADEEIDDTKGKTMEEIDEMIEERELKAGTQILEMVSLKFIRYNIPARKTSAEMRSLCSVD